MEFSAEEFETALITPNDTLADIHIPLLKVSSISLHLFKSMILLLGALKRTLFRRGFSLSCLLALL